MGALFLAYRQARLLTRTDRRIAIENARRVVRWEQQLHLFTERSVQRMFSGSELVIEALNRYYVYVHFPATIAFIVWAYVRHISAYRPIRLHFIAVTVAALGLHVVFPLAPPRMLGDLGFVDTLYRYGPRIYSLQTNQSVANQFAAMPSLHFGWAMLVAISVIGIKRSRRSLLILLHPLLTLLAIVATANHYWLDALVALALIALFAPTRRYRRARLGNVAPDVIERPAIEVDDDDPTAGAGLDASSGRRCTEPVFSCRAVEALGAPPAGSTAEDHLDVARLHHRAAGGS